MPEIPLRKILLHPVTLFIGCVLLIVFGSVALWEQNSKHFLKNQKYQLTPDRILVNNGDMSGELKTLILNEFGDVTPNTLDTNLVAHVASFVESQPFVQQASVRKTASNLHVDVDYRVPVGIVDLGNMQIAVDAQGIILDGRVYASKTADDFLKITLDRPMNRGLNTWEAWPDQRVIAAAQVCGELRHVWNEFELYRVVTYWRPNQSEGTNYDFQAWTKYGGKVVWSTSVGNSNVSAQQKIEAIRQFIEENGSLEKLAGSQILDISSGTVQLLKEQRVAKNIDDLFSK